MLESNLGTYVQTRAELSVYHWPEIEIQDALRQSGEVDLSIATASYRAALQLDEYNVAANRRLGQIELAQGQYEAACQHLNRAWTAAPQQRATRQMLGECDALQGNTIRAVELWRSVDNQDHQLETRIWWYDSFLGEHPRAAALSQVLQAVGQEPVHE
jgi:lipopolysaccharide biosynthesis regulator YciM